MVSRVDRRSARRVTRLLRQVEPAARQELSQEIRRGAERIHGSMLADVPKRTGSLAAALEVRVSRNELKARVGLFGRKAREHFFWRFLEFGTAHSAPQPFVRPAIDEQGPTIIRNIEREVDRALFNLAARGRNTG